VNATPTLRLPHSAAGSFAGSQTSRIQRLKKENHDSIGHSSISTTRLYDTIHGQGLWWRILSKSNGFWKGRFAEKDLVADLLRAGYGGWP